MVSADENDIFRAIAEHDEHQALKLIQQNPTLLRTENHMGQTPLWQASFHGLSEFVAEVLSPQYHDFIDVYQHDNSLRDAFAVAKIYRHDNIVKMLEVSLGEDVDMEVMSEYGDIFEALKSKDEVAAISFLRTQPHLATVVNEERQKVSEIAELSGLTRIIDELSFPQYHLEKSASAPPAFD